MAERLPPGYTFHYVARPCGRGCGVAELRSCGVAELRSCGVAVVYRNTYTTK